MDERADGGTNEENARAWAELEALTRVSTYNSQGWRTKGSRVQGCALERISRGETSELTDSRRAQHFPTRRFPFFMISDESLE